MKLLLFVETPWTKRPVSVPGTVINTTGAWGYGYSQRQIEIRSQADRWWLVECENAEAGRAIIESRKMSLSSPLGRVLAS